MKKCFAPYLAGSLPRLALVMCCLLPLPAMAGAEGFAVRDMAGKTHALADYKGKWLLVNYWATWCPPCLEEIPDLIALHEMRKDVAVIGVAIDYKSKKEVADFVDDNLMSYPIVLGDDNVVKQLGAADVLPTTYIYNPQGELIKLLRGRITRKQVEKILASRR